MPHTDGLIPSAVDLGKEICEVDPRHALNNGAHWPSLVVKIVVCQSDGLALQACIVPGKTGDLSDQVSLQICAPARAGQVPGQLPVVHTDAGSCDCHSFALQECIDSSKAGDNSSSLDKGSAGHGTSHCGNTCDKQPAVWKH